MMNSFMMLPNGKMVDTDPIRTGLNSNVALLGASGSGKTRRFVRPNLETAQESYIVADAKQSLYKAYKEYLENEGYHVLLLSFIHPEKSSHFNMLEYVETSHDIYALADAIVYAHGRDSRADPFWDEAGTMLLSALIGYAVEKRKVYHVPATMHDVIDLLFQMSKGYQCRGALVSCFLDELFEGHESTMERFGRKSYACRQYRKFKTCPEKTRNTVVITLHAVLSLYDSLELSEMLSDNDIDIKSIGQRKTAIFVEASETDRSMDIPINIFYSQVLRVLCDYADNECEEGRLSVPVRFMLDDFATNCRIKDFDKIISNIRSRGISAALMVQSESQLRELYDDAAVTILDNCDTTIYMGGNDEKTAEMIARRCNKTAYNVLHMPLNMCWIFRRGENPVYDRTHDYPELIRMMNDMREETNVPSKDHKTGTELSYEKDAADERTDQKDDINETQELS